MQRRILLLLLMTAVLLIPILASCQPSDDLPNAIESTDAVGVIELRYPRGWISVPGDGIINGRLAITLVQAERDPGDELALYPVLRVSYDERDATLLALNTPLSEYAVRLVSDTLPEATFEPPQALQVAQRPAVTLRGTTAQGLNTQLIIVDFADKNAVVILQLSQPGAITSDNLQMMTRIAESIAVTIQPPPLPTNTPQPEVTSEITAESTAEVSVTAEVAPEATDELTPEITPQPNQPPTAEASGTSEVSP